MGPGEALALATPCFSGTLEMTRGLSTNLPCRVPRFLNNTPKDRAPQRPQVTVDLEQMVMTLGRGRTLSFNKLDCYILYLL